MWREVRGNSGKILGKFWLPGEALSQQMCKGERDDKVSERDSERIVSVVRRKGTGKSTLKHASASEKGTRKEGQ